MEMHKTMTRWMRVLRLRRLVVRLRRVDLEQRQIDDLPPSSDRCAGLINAHRLQVLGVERARLRYLIETIEMRPFYLSAAAAYRRHERAVESNCSSGHSPRLLSSLPRATHR